MNPATRTLLRIEIGGDGHTLTAKSVENLMGTKPEKRFAFISERAEFATDNLLDV